MEVSKAWVLTDETMNVKESDLIAKKLTCFFAQSYLRSPMAGAKVNKMTPLRLTFKSPDCTPQMTNRKHH